MARLLGPDVSRRTVTQVIGSTVYDFSGRKATAYLDSAGTQPATISTYDPANPTTVGAVISNAQVTVGADSRLPLFWFPDNVDTLYLRVAGLAHVWTVTADVDARLDAGGSGIAASALIAAMGTPMRTAHRTGGSAGGYPLGPFPENTREGARGVLAAATAAGITNFVLNVQFQPAGDGTIVAMHDATVDRTTTGTGNVADLTYGAVKALAIDADAYTGSTVWGNTIKVPTVDDILDDFGGKVALNLGVYGASTTGIGQSVVTKVQARGLGPTVILSSFNTLNLAAAKTAGIATMYYPPDEGNTGATAAEILATNVWAAGLPKYVGVNQSSSDAYLQSLITAGLHVSVYFTARRYDRDRLTALGVQGFISDDPIYQFTNTALWTGAVDPYTLGAWPHGALDSDVNLGRGALTANGLKITTQANLQVNVQGIRSPLPQAAGTYTITGSITFDTITADLTRSAQLFLCAPDDRRTSGLANSNAGLVDGYVLLLRANGNMELYRNTQTAQTNIKVGATGTSATITQGATVPFTCQVTPSTITFTRTDVSVSTVWTDSTYRGGYYQVGKSTNIVVSWKIATIG